ncbi:hypothetical protein [Nocardiopsis sp. LOL_012]|uniref:hypothetical protein n=1 Tax=Nocardiopsis sp. LOL_012 TaxID=3345409 RepID=UPI003A86BEF9
MAREEVLFNTDYSEIVWSSDKIYVSAVVDSPEDPDEITERMVISINSETGESHKVPCPGCQSMAPVSGSEVVIARVDPTQWTPAPIAGILEFDLSEADPPSLMPMSSAPNLGMREHFESKGLKFSYADLSWFYGALRFSGGINGVALLTEEDRDEFFLINPIGEIPLQEVGHPYFVGSTGPPALHEMVTPQRSPRLMEGLPAETIDEEMVIAAVTRFDSVYEGCAVSDDIFLVDVESGSVSRTNISPAYPEYLIPGFGSAVSVKDLWWDSGGRLRAVIKTSLCVDTPVTLSGPSEWMLANGQWVQVSDDPVLSVRGLGGNSRVFIEPSEDSSMDGELYFEAGSNTSHVGSGVVAIEVAADNKCFGVQEAVSDDWCGGAIDQGIGAIDGVIELPMEADDFSIPEVSDRDECEDPFFVQYLDENYPQRISEQSLCRDGLAYVHVEGRGPWVYEGSQDLLFHQARDGWYLLGGGTNSHGRFNAADVQVLGVYPDRINELFPEMDLII